MQAYLTQRPADDESRLVGSPLELRLDPAAYQPQVRFTLPEEAASPAVTVNAIRGADGGLTASLFDTDRSGFYEAQLTRADNSAETRRYAMNVDPDEGDLAMLDGHNSRRGWKASSIGTSRRRRSNRPPTIGRLQPRRSYSVRIGLAVDRRADFGLVGQLPSGAATVAAGPRRRRMSTHSRPLWAAASPSQTIRTTFEWGRIQSNADWILPIGVCIAVLLFVRICIAAIRSSFGPDGDGC